MKKYITLLLSIIITIFFLFLSYKNIEKLDITSIKHFSFNYKYILLSIIAFIVALVFRSLAWCYGLDQTLYFRHAFQGITVGMAANMVMPFRIGDAAKTIILNSNHNSKESVSKHQLKDYYVLGVNIIMERFIDVLLLCALLLLSIFFIDFSYDMESKLQWIMKLGIFGFISFGIFLIVFHLFKKRKKYHYKFIKKFYEWTDKVLIFNSITAATKVLLFLSLSWACVYLSTLFGLLSVGLNANIAFLASLLVLVLVNFAILLPTAPGGIGAFQFACVYGLRFFNIDQTTSFVASILLHLVQYAAALPLGLIGFIIWRASNEKSQ